MYGPSSCNRNNIPKFLHKEPRAQPLAFMATMLMLHFIAKENDHQAIPLNCSAIQRQFM